jgi:hypothetical protein
MPMNRTKIEAAITEARHFIDAAQAALKRLDEEKFVYDHEARQYVDRPKAADDASNGSAETGTLRRKSMDLTRNLAELRK